MARETVADLTDQHVGMHVQLADGTAGVLSSIDHDPGLKDMVRLVFQIGPDTTSGLWPTDETCVVVGR